MYSGAESSLYNSNNDVCKTQDLFKELIDETEMEIGTKKNVSLS